MGLLNRPYTLIIYSKNLTELLPGQVFKITSMQQENVMQQNTSACAWHSLTLESELLFD